MITRLLFVIIFSGISALWIFPESAKAEYQKDDFIIVKRKSDNELVVAKVISEKNGQVKVQISENGTGVSIDTYPINYLKEYNPKGSIGKLGKPLAEEQMLALKWEANFKEKMRNLPAGIRVRIERGIAAVGQKNRGKGRVDLERQIQQLADVSAKVVNGKGSIVGATTDSSSQYAKTVEYLQQQKAALEKLKNTFHEALKDPTRDERQKTAEKQAGLERMKVLNNEAIPLRARLLELGVSENEIGSQCGTRPPTGYVHSEHDSAADDALEH